MTAKSRVQGRCPRLTGTGEISCVELCRVAYWFRFCSVSPEMLASPSLDQSLILVIGITKCLVFQWFCASHLV
jgi:hypothetical protein